MNFICQRKNVYTNLIKKDKVNMREGGGCDICKSQNNEQTHQIQQYKIKKCKHCNHMQVYPLPNKYKLNKLYQNQKAHFYANSFQPLMKKDRIFNLSYYSDRLDLVKKISKSNKQIKILDFGCSDGNFVKALIYDGYKHVYGYDIAIKSKKKNLYSGNLEKFKNNFRKKFDIIVSYHTFEHLKSPSSTLKKLYSCLKKNGLLYINVPHILSLQAMILKNKSPIIVPPYHLHYFTKQSLKKMLQLNKFIVLKVETPFWEKSTDIYLEKFIFNNKIIPIILRYLAFPLQIIIKKLGLGGNLSVIAKKI
jgi:2-polyprenyl-3-methyl-5-hydroxy-6-metoxy-1,4-benzoquinol methylase